jgi:hypothetical protein
MTVFGPATGEVRARRLSDRYAPVRMILAWDHVAGLLALSAWHSAALHATWWPPF